MNRLLIVVVGAKRSGKSTFCRALAQALNGVHMETSTIVMRAYERLTGCIIKDSEKETYRPDLETLGDLMTSRCKSRIFEMILADPDIMVSTAPLIISGIRRRMEYFEALELAEANGYEIRTVFVHRTINDPHFSINVSDCATCISNLGTAADLENLARQYACSGCPAQMELAET
jgi:hypothetical protein